jgi:hypothetical protein
VSIKICQPRTRSVVAPSREIESPDEGDEPALGPERVGRVADDALLVVGVGAGAELVLEFSGFMKLGPKSTNYYNTKIETRLEVSA